jgi:hypothetical protein
VEPKSQRNWNRCSLSRLLYNECGIRVPLKKPRRFPATGLQDRKAEKSAKRPFQPENSARCSGQLTLAGSDCVGHIGDVELWPSG